MPILYQSKNSIVSLILLLLLVGIVFLVLCAVLFQLFPWPKTAADFGQATGSISAVFTAFAFAGAFYAVFLQRKSLELQQQQMAKQFEEQRGR